MGYLITKDKTEHICKEREDSHPSVKGQFYIVDLGRGWRIKCKRSFSPEIHNCPYCGIKLPMPWERPKSWK